MAPPLWFALCLVLFNTVSLHYNISSDYIWYFDYSAWFLDIRISTCILSYYKDILLKLTIIGVILCIDK